MIKNTEKLHFPLLVASFLLALRWTKICALYLNAPQQALLLTATDPLLRNKVKRRSVFPEIKLEVPECSRGTQPSPALLYPGPLWKLDSPLEKQFVF